MVKSKARILSVLIVFSFLAASVCGAVQAAESGASFAPVLGKQRYSVPYLPDYTGHAVLDNSATFPHAPGVHAFDMVFNSRDAEDVIMGWYQDQLKVNGWQLLPGPKSAQRLSARHPVQKGYLVIFVTRSTTTGMTSQIRLGYRQYS